MSTVLGLLLIPFSAIYSADHVIRLSSRAFVGERYVVTCRQTAVQEMRWTIDGKENPTGESRVTSLIANAEVLAIGKDGGEIKTRFVIDSLSQLVDGKFEKLLVAGTVVVAERRGLETVFEVDGKLPEGALARTLSSLIFLDDPEQATDEAFFGTNQRKNVGDSWPINAQALASDLTNRLQAPTEAKDITGMVTLESEHEGQLLFVSQMQATNVRFAMAPWMTVSEGTLKFTSRGTFPVDLTKRPLRKSSVMSMSVTGTGEQDGKNTVLRMTYRQASEYTFRTAEASQAPKIPANVPP